MDKYTWIISTYRECDKDVIEQFLSRVAMSYSMHLNFVEVTQIVLDSNIVFHVDINTI